MDVTKLKAWGPWVILRPDEPPTKTAGGILLPEQESTQQKIGMMTGKVLAVSTGHWVDRPGKTPVWVPHDFVSGDHVMARWYLQEANPVRRFYDKACFIHYDDVVGVVGSPKDGVRGVV